MVSKVLAMQAQGPAFDSQHLHKKPGVLSHNCSTGTVETSSSLGLSERP